VSLPTPLTAAEAAKVLRTGVWTVVKLCRDGDLPASKPGKSWLIDPSDLRAYIDASSNQRKAS
jgi:excisionase family DNA binding protein